VLEEKEALIVRVGQVTFSHKADHLSQQNCNDNRDNDDEGFSCGPTRAAIASIHMVLRSLVTIDRTSTTTMHGAGRELKGSLGSVGA